MASDCRSLNKPLFRAVRFASLFDKRFFVADNGNGIRFSRTTGFRMRFGRGDVFCVGDCAPLDAVDVKKDIKVRNCLIALKKI